MSRRGVNLPAVRLGKSALAIGTLKLAAEQGCSVILATPDILAGLDLIQRIAPGTLCEVLPSALVIHFRQRSR